MSDAEGALPRDTRRWVEALTWHETLTEANAAELTSTIVRDWQTWYADPENQRLFDNLSQLVIDGKDLRWRAFRPEAKIVAVEYDLALSIAAWQKSRSSKRARAHWLAAPRLLPWLSRGPAVAAVAVLAALLYWQSWLGIGAGHGGGPATFQTDIGGLKTVRLSDGSNITLGGGTKLSVAFSSRVRSVQLVQGEAWFRVAHDSRWPFIVHAGNGAIRAVGTAFLVTRDSDRVVVTVTEGTVAVTAPPLVKLPTAVVTGSPRLPVSIRLSRGEEISYGQSGAVASVTHANVHAATAWTHGRLIFDDEPLRYVIENVSRYFPQRILATAAAGRLRFSGVILHDGIQEWIGGLPGIFPVDVDHGGAAICIRMRATQTHASCSAPR